MYLNNKRKYLMMKMMATEIKMMNSQIKRKMTIQLKIPEN